MQPFFFWRQKKKPCGEKEKRRGDSVFPPDPLETAQGATAPCESPGKSDYRQRCLGWNVSPPGILRQNAEEPCSTLGSSTHETVLKIPPPSLTLPTDPAPPLRCTCFHICLLALTLECICLFLLMDIQLISFIILDIQLMSISFFIKISAIMTSIGFQRSVQYVE